MKRPQPTLPKIAVELDGTPLPPAAQTHLEEVRISRILSQPSMCELTFVMPGPSPSPRAGMSLRLTVGDTSTLLFAGEIAAIEWTLRSTGERLLFLRAYDPLLKLRRQHHIRAWTQASAASLAGELASSIDLTSDISTSAPAFPTLIQSGENDLDFLASIAERSGLFFTLDGDSLQLLSLQGAGDEIVLEANDTLLEASIESNATFASATVKHFGWDTSHVLPYTAEASASASQDAPVLLPNRNAAAQEIAQASAAAEQVYRRARSRTIQGAAEGNPTLAPGTRIRTKGLPSTLPDTFTLVSVTHHIDATSGFITRFSSTPPPRRELPSAASIALGVVTDIQDPEQLGRLRVSVPALNDVETGWLELVTIGAGPGKGFVNLSDRGDKVVVLFPRGDLGSGLILGGLYGAQGPGDYGVNAIEDKITRYALLTPGGNKLRFDDSRKSLRIEDHTGTYLEFTPAAATLHSAVDLHFEAPGRNMILSANQIDFRRS